MKKYTVYQNNLPDEEFYEESEAESYIKENEWTGFQYSIYEGDYCDNCNNETDGQDYCCQGCASEYFIENYD